MSLSVGSDHVQVDPGPPAWTVADQAGAKEPFELVGRLARRGLGVQSVIVSIVDLQHTSGGHDRRGDVAAVSGLRVSGSLCRLVVTAGVGSGRRDRRTDRLVRNRPAVVEGGASRHAGVPLEVDDREVVGTLCVLSAHPRVWSEDELGFLEDLGGLAVTELVCRLRLNEVESVESLALRLPEPAARLSEAVRSMASVAEDPRDPRLPRLADLARTRLRPVETLIEDLQRAAGRHREQRSATEVPVDLGSRVQRAVRLALSSAEGQDLVLVLPERPVEVLARLLDLDHALSLLLVTALHHREGGAATVEVAARDGGGGVLTVVHPGRPVPTGDLLRVVGAFSPADQDRPVDVRLRQGVTRVRSARVTAVSGREVTTVAVAFPGPSPARVPVQRTS